MSVLTTRRTGVLQRVTAGIANNPRILRAISGPVRRFAPIISIGRVVVVTRYADVREVLDRDTDFTIAEVNAATMDRVNGPFILGMDRSPLYDRERSILRRCVHEGDPARIRAEVAATAAGLVDAVRDRGRIDVVQDFARPAAVRLVDSYFGVAGPDLPTMMRWMRILFHESFLNSGGNPSVRRAAEVAAAEFHEYADGLIARRRAQIEAGEPSPDDFLTRLIRLRSDPQTRLTDEGVRRNIGGIVVGAVDTTSKATAHVVDELLRHPEAFRRATEAAREDDVDLVGRYTADALRFNPLTAAQVRHTARDTVLAAGTRRRKRIPSGRTVYAAVLPAMFDPAGFHDPGTLRADRPLSRYLTFGHGMHACFGRYVNAIQIPELVAALLRCDNLRRAPGRAGRITYAGPFPDRFVLDFN